MQLLPELKAYIEKFGYAHLKQGQEKQSSYKKELKQIFTEDLNFYSMIYWLIKFRLIPEQPMFSSYTDEEFCKGRTSVTKPSSQSKSTTNAHRKTSF